MKRIISFCIAALFICAVGLAKEPQQPQSYNYQRGVELVQSGKMDEGISYLNKELNQNIKNGYAYSWMASAYFMKNEKGTAIHMADLALKHLPKTDKYYIAWVHCLTGQIYLQMQDTAKALLCFSNAIKTEPKNEEWYEYRGHLYRDLKQWDKSDADFQQYIKLTPGLVRGIKMFAHNLYLQGRYEEALEQYNYANKLAERAYTYGAMAQIEIKLGLYEKAAEHIITCLKLESGESTCMEIIKDCNEKEFLEIIEEKLHAQTLANPNELNWYLCMMYSQHAMQEYEKAIITCQKIQSINADAYFDDYMADLYYSMGDWEHALHYQNKAIASDTTDIGFRFSRAFTYCEMDSIEQMYADIDYLISQHPDDAKLYFARAGFRFFHADYAAAIEDYTNGLAFRNSDWERYQRGRCFEAVGRMDKAQKDYQYILSHSHTPEVRMFVLASLGLKEQALVIADSLLKVDSIQYRYNVACVYALSGKDREAMRLIEKELQDGYVRFGNLRNDPDLQTIQGEELETIIQQHQTNVQNRIMAFSRVQKAHDGGQRTVEIPFTAINGVTKVECTINGLPLNFVFDTGASNVTISQTEANFMFKNGYLSQRDIVGTQRFRTADGNVSIGTVFVLNHINFGGLELTGVRASVVDNQNAPLLLGQTVLKRLGKIEIDNERRVLKVTTNQ